jgi:hypothetical protein
MLARSSGKLGLTGTTEDNAASTLSAPSVIQRAISSLPRAQVGPFMLLRPGETSH